MLHLCARPAASGSAHVCCCCDPRRCCTRDVAATYRLLDGAPPELQQRQQQLAHRKQYSAGVIAYNWVVRKHLQGLLHHSVFLSGACAQNPGLHAGRACSCCSCLRAHVQCVQYVCCLHHPLRLPHAPRAQTSTRRHGTARAAPLSCGSSPTFTCTRRRAPTRLPHCPGTTA